MADEQKENKDDSTVELGDTGEIELPQIDVSQYVGKKVLIEKVTEHESKLYGGYYIKVETVPVDTIGEGDKAIEVKGSRIFGLQEDAEGKIGWGKDTNLGLFLGKMGVPHYRELKGKEVQLQTVTNKKDKKDYLTFN